jgi:thiosulfate/3-mercaptopyruvate sulfurtransferase
MPAAVLISALDLSSRLGEAIVVDASWIYGPFNHAGIDVRQRYAGAHIRGAWFLDLEDLSDPDKRYDPRVEVLTPPRAGDLQAVMVQAGAGPASLIVVTDMDGGCTTAPFARHALIQAGFVDVRLLDGGTPAWGANRALPLGDETPRYLDRRLVSRAGREGVIASGSPVFVEHEAFMEALQHPGRAQIIDSRMSPENEGILPDAYAGLAVPAGCTVPSGSVLDDAGAGMRFKAPEDLRHLFAAAGTNTACRKITTCYFGLGASVVATALEIAGEEQVRVHAGSLIEDAALSGLVRLA